MPGAEFEANISRERQFVGITDAKGDGDIHYSEDA